MLGRIFGRLEVFTKRSPNKSEAQRAQRRDSIKKREALLQRTISEIRGTTIEEVSSNKTKSPLSKYPTSLLESSGSDSDTGSSDTDESDTSDSDNSNNSKVKKVKKIIKDSKNENTMNPLLREFGLEAYASSFRENGFDTPVKISGMTSSDVDTIKMKLIHKKKLTKMINHLVEHPPKPEGGDESSDYSSDSSSQSSMSSQSRQSTQSRQSSQSRQSVGKRPSLREQKAVLKAASSKSDSDSDFDYMEKPKKAPVLPPAPAPVRSPVRVPAPKQNSHQMRRSPVSKPNPVEELNHASSESSSSSSGSSSSSDSRSRSSSASSASSMSEMSEMDQSPVKAHRVMHRSSSPGQTRHSPHLRPHTKADQSERSDSATKQLFNDNKPNRPPSPPPSPKYVPPQPRKPNPDKHRVSDLIAAAEDHVRVLVSAIAEQSQLLDKEKLKLVAEQEILQEALQGNSSTTNVLDSEVAKVDKRLRADRVERDYLKEAENELKEKVKALKEENEDLDDQLEVDTESFEAKDEEMEDLLHQQADIKEEKEALLSLIQETKKKLESKQYLARVAKRQERVAKASHTATTKTKYANVRYTMTK